VSTRDFDLLIENYRRLDPAGKLFVREVVLERAQNLRGEFIYALFRKLLSWYWQRAAIAQLQDWTTRR
jgi:hypothetical protein